MDTLRATAATMRRLRLLLKDPSARRQSQKALAEGPRLVLEALHAGRARALWVTPRAAEDPAFGAARDAARAAGLPLQILGEDQWLSLADTREPQGWLCEIALGGVAFPGAATIYLALDALQDPGNLGTLLRSAWAANAAVLLGPGCADAWSPKVLRAGAGAQFHVPLFETENLYESLRELGSKDVRIYATSPRATSGHIEADCRRPVCWLLGSEGRGISPEGEAACDQSFHISYPGGAESLNVAVSGAILLFETLRQRA